MKTITQRELTITERELTALEGISPRIAGVWKRWIEKGDAVLIRDPPSLGSCPPLVSIPQRKNVDPAQEIRRSRYFYAGR